MTNKIHVIKDGLCVAAGAVGAFISACFGGWDAGIATLIVFMAVDYITGMICAGVFHRSPKTPNGALESRAGWKGLVRKCLTLVMVLVAAQLDRLIGSNFIRDAVVIGFAANEVISIVENMGLIGIPVPKVIISAIEVLKRKEDAADRFADKKEGDDDDEDPDAL